MHIYRKPKDIDQDLDFLSHQPDEHQAGVGRALRLHQRTASVTPDPVALKSELQHVNNVLRRSHFGRKKGFEPQEMIKLKNKTTHPISSNSHS